VAHPAGTFLVRPRVFPGRLFPRGTGDDMGTPSMNQEEPQVRSCVFLGMTAIIASEPMLRLLETVERVARSMATVLITGESGSGKELIARAVHHFSPRGHKPWVDLSCAALPEHLLESELFGYDKGAFSGADSAKPGLFELAHQGTIFLDEIGELDPRMQVKLLRVLDGVPYYRLGGVKKVSADVRVVAATNQDLELGVKEGRFRNDLYHRLSQFTLRVPPLRERVEDIAPLARHILWQHDRTLKLTHRAMHALESHSWPGNIRELRNVVIKAAVMTPRAEIDAADLPFVAPSPEAPARIATNGSVNLDGMERQMILEALMATGGHQQNAAIRLGISRRTLSRKLRTYAAERVSAAL
jgi:transcriptional regulator with PAS, ATPase and Fis domain